MPGTQKGRFFEENLLFLHAHVDKKSSKLFDICSAIFAAYKEA
jgi:hypothetical protein